MQEIIELYREEYDRTGSDKALEIINGLGSGAVDYYDCTQSCYRHSNILPFDAGNRTQYRS